MVRWKGLGLGLTYRRIVVFWLEAFADNQDHCHAMYVASE